MATGFAKGATDLDDIFDPYVQGSKPGLTGFTAGGSDLRDRYAPLSYGTQAAATGFSVGGADLNTLFAAKGTAVYTIPGLHGAYYNVADQALTSQSSVSATVGWSIKSDGTWAVTGGNAKGGVTLSPASGTWLPAGESAANWEVQFVVTKSGSGDVANGAVAYSNCGSTRTGSFTLPVAGGTSAERSGSATVTVYLRRIGSSASASTFSIDLFTAGYQ